MQRRKPDFEGVGSDRAAFVDAEGLNSTANWTLLRAEQDVALSDEAVTDLSERFGFPVEDLRRLGIDLAIALDPEHTPANAPLDLPKAAARARKTGTAMHEQLGRAMDRIDEAHLGLDKLHADPLLHGTARRRLRKLHEKMAAAHELLSALRTETRWIADNEDAAVVEATPSDQRKIADLRRQHVLKCIFAFWERSGRKLTVTTDAMTSERRGALVDFANAIVVCVTDPSEALSGETIRKDLKQYRATERP